jgi:heme exporter protein B
MTAFWWIVHKDLVSEFRSRRVWPAMLLLGMVVALVFSLQVELLPEHKQQLVGGLLWLAVFFAGTLVFDRSFAAEREEGCWDGMRLLPISSGTVFLAKLTVNLLALAALEGLLIPLFFLLSDVPLAARAGPLALIGAFASPGLAAVGTLVSGLATGGGKGGQLLVLVVLPLAIPVLLAAAECTRLTVENRIDDAWWRWLQLEGAFSVVFVTAGALLFEYAIED